VNAADSPVHDITPCAVTVGTCSVSPLSVMISFASCPIEPMNRLMLMSWL
jgi:hypothetical protein